MPLLELMGYIYAHAIDHEVRETILFGETKETKMSEAAFCPQCGKDMTVEGVNAYSPHMLRHLVENTMPRQSEMCSDGADPSPMINQYVQFIPRATAYVTIEYTLDNLNEIIRFVFDHGGTIQQDMHSSHDNLYMQDKDGAPYALEQGDFVVYHPATEQLSGQNRVTWLENYEVR